MTERDPDLDLLRRLLTEEADRVQISGDGLDRIRARTTAPIPWWRRAAVPALAAAAAAVVVAAVGVVAGQRALTRAPVAGGVTGSTAAPTATPTPTTSPGPTVPPPGPTAPPSTAVSPTGRPAARLVVPVYYVVDTRIGPRLAREFHAVVTTRTAAEAALEEMLDGPDDPDHRTLLAGSGIRVLSVTRLADRIVVDLAGAVESRLTAGEEGPEGVLLEQQVAWTVTAAIQANLPVDVRDRSGPQTFEARYQRSPENDVLAPIQLDDPVERAQVARTFTVRGRAALFEAQLDWRLLRGGAVVRSGFAMTAEGQRFAPYEFRVTAPGPGTYVLEVAETDPSGGEGGPPFAETRTITVR